MKNLILYWPRLFREIWFSIKYYKAVKSIQAELTKENLRVDWIGRIYTVINLEGEMLKQPEMMQQTYVFQQLKPLSELLLKHGLSNDAYPEISKINNDSFLVVLYPENQYLNLLDIFKNLLYTSGLIISCYLLYKYLLVDLFWIVKPYLNV
jgi:hypothetical protein